jgi:hypothetical protein
LMLSPTGWVATFFVHVCESFRLHCSKLSDIL